MLLAASSRTGAPRKGPRSLPETALHVFLAHLSQLFRCFYTSATTSAAIPKARSSASTPHCLAYSHRKTVPFPERDKMSFGLKSKGVPPLKAASVSRRDDGEADQQEKPEEQALRDLRSRRETCWGTAGFPQSYRGQHVGTKPEVKEEQHWLDSA